MLPLTEARVRLPELLMLASPLMVTKVGAELVTPTKIWPLVEVEVVAIEPDPLPRSKAF